MNGIKVIRIWTYMAANEGTIRRIANYLSYMFSALIVSLFLPRPDIIIATSPQFFCGWAGLLTSKLRRVSFVLEIRDIWPESILAVGAISNRHVIRVLEWLARRMYAWSPHIITVGEGYRAKLIEKGVPETKISVVMNGVDRNVFFPRDPDSGLIERYELQDKFVVVYAGTIGMASGLEIVVRAGDRLQTEGKNNIVFVLVGDGSERKRLQSLVRQRGLTNVIFTGRQPKEMIPRFLSVADVCLIHLRETKLFTTVMPSKIFEACGMSKPVLVGVSGFASQFIERAEAGIPFEPENDSGMLQAIKRLASDPDLCDQLGQRGRNFVVTNFDRERLAEDYLGIIGNVADGIDIRELSTEKRRDLEPDPREDLIAEKIE